ncbi:MAG: dihydroorotate dehydrogenase electron transfer subunit [Solirubrobacteraceae bacterium]|jgi:NAD(P)H-flavin reductase|nr:dihydroorotate dehydrogenase electron transfer subunit [Solirubrobacteraceae bacterium]
MSLAPLERRRLRVTGNDELGAYRVLRVADDGPAPAPGQFAMLATVERWGGGQDERPYLPRAFSVARWRDGEAEYLLEDVGPGTQRLGELAAGDEVWALGPLGQGFREPADGRRAVLVGGGVGIAPLAIWQDALLARQLPHALLLGFRDGAHAEGANYLRCAQVATDDGSLGHHGYVTDLLAQALDEEPRAEVYSCGPPLMLEAVRALCEERGVPAQLALESGMACGFGACFGCVVPTRDGGYVRVCVDGPVLDAALLTRIDGTHSQAPAPA